MALKVEAMEKTDEKVGHLCMAPYASNKLGREEDDCLGPTTGV